MNITYLPIGTRNTASSRLRVYKIAAALAGMGHNISIANPSFDVSSADVVVVQKRMDCADQMAHWIKEGRRVIWDVDDWIKNTNIPDGVQITVDTPYKLELYPDAAVIPDVLDIEYGAPIKVTHSDKLERVVWVGNPENWGQMRHVFWAAEKTGIEIVAITNTSVRPYATHPNIVGVQWDVASVDSEIIQADLMVCPYIYDGEWSAQWVKSKSANRLLKGWALNMPVAGTAIPSYIEAGLQYRATTTDEWEHVFDLLTHREAREHDAERGHKIAQQYRAERVAEQWVKVFNG